MPDHVPSVKHITKTCPIKNCNVRAFVQVLVFDDAAKQKKVYNLAKEKLSATHRLLHKNGKHEL